MDKQALISEYDLLASMLRVAQDDLALQKEFPDHPRVMNAQEDIADYGEAMKDIDKELKKLDPYWDVNRYNT